MSHDRLRTALVEEIGVDHATRTEIRARMAKIRQRRAVVRRRRFAVAGAAATVAAAVGAVFVFGGTIAAPFRPVPLQAPTSPTDSYAASIQPVHPAPAVLLTDDSAAAPASQLVAEANAQIRVENAEVKACLDVGRGNPVAANGTVAPAAVEQIVSACAASFRATTPPEMTWVTTDGRGVEAFLGSSQPPVNPERVVLVRVEAQLAPRFGTESSLPVWLLTIPLDPTSDVVVYFLDSAVPDVDVLGRLGSVQQGSAAPASSATTQATQDLPAAQSEAEKSATAEAEEAAKNAEIAAAAAQTAAQTCSDFGRRHPVAPRGVVDAGSVVRLAESCAKSFKALAKPQIAWVETDAVGVQTLLGLNAPPAVNGRFLLVTIEVDLAPPFGDASTINLGILTIPLARSAEVGVNFPATIAAGATLEQWGTVHRN